jgi:hypothetical protein
MINYAAFINNINTVFTDSVNPSEVIQNVRSSAVSLSSYFYIFRSLLILKKIK